MEEAGHLAELGRRIKHSKQLEEVIVKAGLKNPWFTPLFVRQAIDALVSEMLDEAKLQQWLGRYPLHPVNKTVALIFAGNIPLVGLHDFICCYVSGYSIKIKQSSKDDELFPFVLRTLAEIDPASTKRIEICDRLKGFDAVIATGSDNTNRYFEYYFRNYPKILRKNRNSVAILEGTESEADLQGLADDIFMYFGLGCRNVSKLYVPVDYDVSALLPHFTRYSWLHNHSHYMNNYDYNRTVLLLNKTPHFANEFLAIVQNPALPSPISILHYETWHDENVLKSHLADDAGKIQCIVSGNPAKWETPSSVKFGQSQHPELWDYADNVDTMEFLLKLG